DGRHVPVDRRILNDTEPLPDFHADVRADLQLFVLRDVQVVEFLLRVLRFLCLVQNTAELRVRRRADGRQHRDEYPHFHNCASFVAGDPTVPDVADVSARPTTSKMATGRVLPFTTTSPRGLNMYRSGRAARVASLMIIRVEYCLFSDSRRDPRFTASPITV